LKETTTMSNREQAVKAFDDIATTASKAMALVTTNAYEASILIRNLSDRLEVHANNEAFARERHRGGIDVA
jgi:hypothetical protein